MLFCYIVLYELYKNLDFSNKSTKVCHCQCLNITPFVFYILRSQHHLLEAHVDIMDMNLSKYQTEFMHNVQLYTKTNKS